VRDAKPVPRPEPPNYVTLLGVTGPNAPNELLIEWGRRQLAQRSESLEADEEVIKRIESAESFDCLPYTMTDELKRALVQGPRLKWLKADRKASADDLEWIVKLELRGLSLAGADLQNADLGVLRKLDELQWLNLAGTKLPPSGKGLPHLPKLEVLFLDESGSDDYLPAPGQFPKLKALGLRFSTVTDDGLKKLVEANAKLRYLNVAGVQGVTSRSIPVLGKLQLLEYLHVGNTELERESYSVQDDTIPELQRLLPKCYIGVGS